MFHRNPPPLFLNNLLFLSGKSIIRRGQMHDFGDPVQKDYDNAVTDIPLSCHKTINTATLCSYLSVSVCHTLVNLSLTFYDSTQLEHDSG